MKTHNYLQAFLWVAITGFSLLSCTSQQSEMLLPSWNDTPVKEKLLNFMEADIKHIPVADRIAVFDLDGTVACERPLGMEMQVSIHRMIERGESEPDIRNSKEYQFARKLAVNPRDTAVFNHCYADGKNYLDNITMKAFEGMDNEAYVQYAYRFLNCEQNKRFGRKYADLFYQPMLELIDLLKKNQFQIYIVSGSMQGLVWSICPQNVGLDRQHLLGTYQAMKVSYPKDGPASYIIQNAMLKPKNTHDGKSINIYNHIGKVPVVAVGNTYGDFGIFHLVSCSPYPHLVLMLNHDDENREYAYEPHHGNVPYWQDSLRLNDWIQADMSKEFRVIWKK